MAACETESDGETGAGGEHRGRAEVLQKGVRFLRMEAPVGVTQPSSHLTLPPAPGIFSGSLWVLPRPGNTHEVKERTSFTHSFKK